MDAGMVGICQRASPSAAEETDFIAAWRRVVVPIAD